MPRHLLGAFALSDAQIPEGGQNTSRRVALLTTTNGVVNNGNGDFEVRSEDLELYAESLRTLPTEAQFDYDHSFIDKGDSRAAGWIKKDSVTVDGNTLFADVEWTPRAAAAIRDREYRYVSPEFVPLKRDDAGEVTQQPRLQAAGLTNRPFLKTLGEITLTDKSLRDLAGEQNPFRLIDEQAAKRLADHFHVDSLDIVALAGGRTPEKPSTQEDDMAPNPQILKALGLDEKSDDSAIEKAIQALTEKASKAPDAETLQKLSDAAAQGVQALAELKVVKAERDAEKVQRMFDTAVRERRMTPVERETLSAITELPGGIEKVQALLEARPVGSFAAKGVAGDGVEEVEKASAKVDGTVMDFDVSPEALHEQTVKALRESGVTGDIDENGDAYRNAGRKIAQKLRAA
jgi:phage I-like protein